MAATTNNATLLRRELLTRMARLLRSRDLEPNVDRIPLEMRPKGFEDVSRCCIYKDRAMLRYKIMALLGFNIEDETDELTPLSEYVRRAFSRGTLSSKPLTVVDMACRACVKTNYVVTNMCQGCVGRPCMFSCNKDAIEIREGRAHIDHGKCVNCGLCQKNCPFHAIVYVPVPCEESCPVGAISKDSQGVEHIDYAKCIYCGKCVSACPFGAVMEKSHLVDLIRAFREERPVVAMVAPAIAGQFKVPLEQILGAIRAVGFREVIEVAKGADVTTANEAAEFTEKMAAGQPFMTTSCCPSFTASVYKHMPELAKYVSHTKTPMAYTAEIARKMYPDAVLVFVGPCLAKRHEAFIDEHTDYMLSFEELAALMEAMEIEVGESAVVGIDPTIDPTSRRYPVSGGVAGAIIKRLDGKIPITPLTINGIDKAAIREMKNFVKTCPGNLVEVMACEGGCVGGCGVINNPRVAARLIGDQKQ
jgi:[FeFe] hydrogenase (group B1/B3)